MFLTYLASANQGAICSTVKPARPQPIGVTKKVKSGLLFAVLINFKIE